MEPNEDPAAQSIATDSQATGTQNTSEPEDDPQTDTHAKGTSSMTLDTFVDWPDEGDD